ncbi:MAG: rubredoxin-like domain-containing protein [Candidatus Dojkabacteria bacterium]|jgi:rubrerythrin
MEDILNNDQSNPLQPSQPNLTPVEYDKLNPNPEREDLDSMWLRWKCMMCGYLYEGAVTLKVCPKCGNNNPDKFNDAE